MKMLNKTGHSMNPQETLLAGSSQSEDRKQDAKQWAQTEAQEV